MATRMAKRTTGSAAAAIVAAGIGTFTIGLMTALAEASAGLRGLLNWYNPAGPLSGKTGVGVLVWLMGWILLHSAWKGREINFSRAFRWTVALVVVGFLLTFPPVFELLAE